MIRVGLIGAGFIGRNHFNQYEKLSNRAKVTALSDKQAERLAGDWSNIGGNLGDKHGTKRDLGQIKPYADWRDLIADPEIDLVDICCPTFLHTDIALSALSAGKHVLCEKPMALNVADCDAILAAAEKATGRLMVAQCIRFWPEYAYLRDIFEDGRFGACRALTLRRQAEAPAHSLNNWVLKPELSGGALLDLHIHDIDYAQYVLGKPQAITARGWLSETGAIDRVHALWDYGRNLVVQIEGYWDMPTGFGFNMGFTAAFDKAAVVWDLASENPLTVHPVEGDSFVPDMPVGGDGYFGEIDYFLGCIENDQPPTLCPPAASRDDVALALAEKQSIETGTTVTV